MISVVFGKFDLILICFFQTSDIQFFVQGDQLLVKFGSDLRIR